DGHAVIDLAQRMAMQRTGPVHDHDVDRLLERLGRRVRGAAPAYGQRAVLRDLAFGVELQERIAQRLRARRAGVEAPRELDARLGRLAEVEPVCGLEERAEGGQHGWECSSRSAIPRIRPMSRGRSLLLHVAAGVFLAGVALAP